ncbi:MAG TPA: aldehyde dehydrogenase family protein, partial [Acidimicrobiia bacterium]|nr:aldehyde dehydrogenase family protein [Acidimicrobiia bacterium]
MANPQVLIGGEWVDTDAGYDVVNPATEDVVGIAPEASVAQAHDAARAAQDAFPAWSQTSPHRRAELLQRTADVMKERMGDLLPLVIAETGCTATVGKQMQVPQARVRFETYARLAHEAESPGVG